MLTSARNTFYGTIEWLGTGTVYTEVVLDLGSDKIVATITNTSAERLKMTIGSSAYALIKSSSLIISRERPKRISARNVLAATVTEVIRGAVNAEIRMRIGDSTMTAIITNDSSDELKLKKDDTVYAIFKASSVILGMM